MAYFMYQGLELLVITLVGLLVSYFMVPFVVVLSAIAGFIAMRYLNGAREVKRYVS